MFQAGDSDLEDVEVILDRARGPRKCSESSERLKVQVRKLTLEVKWPTQCSTLLDYIPERKELSSNVFATLENQLQTRLQDRPWNSDHETSVHNSNRALREHIHENEDLPRVVGNLEMDASIIENQEQTNEDEYGPGSIDCTSGKKDIKCYGHSVGCANFSHMTGSRKRQVGAHLTAAVLSNCNEKQAACSKNLSSSAILKGQSAQDAKLSIKSSGSSSSNKRQASRRQCTAGTNLSAHPTKANEAEVVHECKLRSGIARKRKLSNSPSSGITAAHRQCTDKEALCLTPSEGSQVALISPDTPELTLPLVHHDKESKAQDDHCTTGISNMNSSCNTVEKVELIQNETRRDHQHQRRIGEPHMDSHMCHPRSVQEQIPRCDSVNSSEVSDGVPLDNRSKEFNNFREDKSDVYPVEVEKLSRFCSLDSTDKHQVKRSSKSQRDEIISSRDTSKDVHEGKQANKSSASYGHRTSPGAQVSVHSMHSIEIAKSSSTSESSYETVPGVDHSIDSVSEQFPYHEMGKSKRKVKSTMSVPSCSSPVTRARRHQEASQSDSSPSLRRTDKTHLPVVQKTPGLLGRKKAQKNRKTNHWSVRKRRTRQRSKSNNERLLPVPVTAAPPMSLPIESPGTRRRGHNVSPTSRYQLRKKSVIGDSSPSTVSHLRQGASDQDVCKQGTERSGTFKSGCNNITGSPDEHSQEAFFEHTSQQVGLPHNPSKGCLSGTDGDTKVGTSPKSHITSQNEMSEESSLCPSDITHLPEAQTDSHEAQYELGIELPNTHHVPIIPILDSQSHNTSHHTHLEGSGSSMSSMDPAHISLECGEDHHKEGELKKRQRMRFIKSSSLSLETEGNQATQCVDGLPLDSQEGKSRESSPSVRFRLRRKTLFEEPCPTSIPDVEQEAKVQNVHKKTETSRTTKSSHKNRESLGTSSNQSQEAVLDWTSSQVTSQGLSHEEMMKEYSSVGSISAGNHGLKVDNAPDSIEVNQPEMSEEPSSLTSNTQMQSALRNGCRGSGQENESLPLGSHPDTEISIYFPFVYKSDEAHGKVESKEKKKKRIKGIACKRTLDGGKVSRNYDMKLNSLTLDPKKERQLSSSKRYWLRKQHVISDSDPSSISDHEQVAKDLNVHEKESKKIRAAKYDFGNVGESLSSAAKQSQEATKEYSSKGSLTDDHGLKAKDLCESLSVNQHEEHEKSPSMANDTHVQEAHKGAFKYDEMKKKGLSDDLLVSRAPFHELESCNIPSCIPGTHPDADTSLDYEPILHETDKDDNEKKELKDGNTRKQVFPFEDFDPVSIARRKNSFSQEVQNREFSSPIRKSQVCKKSDNAGSGSTSTICEVSETAGMLLPPCSTTTNYAKTSHENGAEIVKVSPNTTQKSSAYQEQGNGRQENLLDDPEKVQLEDSDQQSAQCHPGLSFEDAEGKQCSPVATNASDMVQPSACTPCFISLPKMFLGNDVSNDGLASSTFRSETEEMDYEPEAFGSCVNYADSPIRSTSMADPTKDRNSYEKGNAIASDSSSSDSSSSDDDMSSSSSSSSLSSKAGNLGQLPSGSCSSWSNSSKEEAGTREKISLHSDDEKGPQKNEDPKLSESADNEDGRQSFKWKKQRTFSAPGSIVEEVGEDDAIVIDDEDDLPILSVSDTSDGGCEEEKGSEGSQQDSHGMSVTSITKSDDSQLWISVHSCKSTATPGGARHEVVSQVVETENYEKIEHMTGPCHLSQVKPSKTASPEKSPANKKEKETFGAILRNIYQRSCYQHIFSECFGTCRYNHNVMLADVMSHQEELSWDYDQAVSHFHWVMGKERRFRRLKIDIFCHLVESLLNADQSGESLKVICQYGPRSPRVLDLLMKKVEEIGTKLQPFQQLHPLIQKVRKHAYVPTATQMICILDIMLYHRCTEGLLDWADYLVQQSLMVLPKSILNRTVSLVLSTTKQDPHQNWLTKFYAVLAKMSESDICNMDPYHATLVIDALDQNGYGAEAMYLRNMVFPQEASVSQQRHSSGPVWASAAQRQIDLQNSAFGKKRMSDLMHRMPIQDGSDSEEKSQVESQRQVFMLMQQNAYGEIAQLLMDLDMSTKAGHMCVQQITKHLISSGCPGQDFDVFVTKIFEHMKDKYPSSDILQKVAEIAACLLSHLKEQKCSDNEFLRVLDVVMLQNLDLMQVSKESQRKESGYIILLYIQLLGKTNRLPEVVPKLKELRGSLPSLKPAHVDFACHVMKKVINKCILNVKLCSEALECFRFLLEVCQDGILQDKIGESSCDGGPNSYLEQIEGLLAGMAMSVFNSRSASHINKLKDLAMEKKEFFFTPVHLPILREMVVHLVNLEVLEDAKAWFTICSRKGLLVPFSKANVTHPQCIPSSFTTEEMALIIYTLLRDFISTSQVTLHFKIETGPSSGLIVTPSPSESLGDVLLRMREALDRIQDSFPLFRITPQNLAPNAVIFQVQQQSRKRPGIL